MGRNLLALLVPLGAMLLYTPASAATSEFQITPRLGAGSLKVRQFAGVNQERVNKDTLGVGATLGYLTPISVVLEIGADSFGDIDIWNISDSFSLSQQFAAVGYQFDLGNRWRFVPRVGRAHWKLHSKETPLFNPGPEETRNVKGNDYFWEVGVARQVSRVVTLGASFRQGQYDFGRTQSAAFTVTMGF